MLLMLACGVLLVAGVALAWRWRAYALDLPAWAGDSEDGRAAPLRALVWLLNVALVSGLLVGVLVVGPAGRLVMRLLAATSGVLAQGRVTEADQVVGEITVSGTLSLFTFVGLPFGVVVAAIYALAGFVLPRGVLGGAIVGAGLLVLFGSTVDPLREDNPDFALLAPGWLGVVAFGAMAVLTGAVLAPVAGRVGAALGPPKVWWALWLVPVGLAVGATLAVSEGWVSVVAIGACLAFVLALRVPPAQRQVVWRRGRRTVQALLAVVVLAAAPGFVSAVLSIAA